MKLVYESGVVTNTYMDYVPDDTILASHPNADILNTTKIVNINNNVLQEVQEAGFAAETGLIWNGSAWVLTDATQKAINIEKAKHITRLKLADIDNPVTGLKMSSETEKWAIERDLEHNSTNMLMILQQDSTDEPTKTAIKSAQAQGIALLTASKQVYAEINADVNYDYVNSTHWPV